MLNVHELPYLTADVPGIGGRIKTLPEDFRVDEVPLYEASGEGTHVYFRVRKKGVPTMQAVEDVARALGRPSRDIGYAGLKDADAVTTQTLSLEHIDPGRIEAIDLRHTEVLEISRHTNKLKLGHLKGNRFTIRVRDVDTGRVDDVRAIMERLSRRGVPNYFGPQRFGMRGDTWLIGRGVLREDYAEALSWMLGRPGPADYGEVRRARELYDAARHAEAAEYWPYPFSNERRICRAMARSNPDPRRAFRTADKRLQRLVISAYQSHLFNQVVAQRLDTIDQLVEGDLAWRHPQGAVFRVEDLDRERPRCEVFEISPTGPLYGYRMSKPGGEPGRIEQELIDAEGMQPEDWREGGRHRIKGARRPLRFQPQDVKVEPGEDEAGPFIELAFFLESGCYATTVLREICKNDESLVSVRDD